MCKSLIPPLEFWRDTFIAFHDIMSDVSRHPRLSLALILCVQVTRSFAFGILGLNTTSLPTPDFPEGSLPPLLRQKQTSSISRGLPGCGITRHITCLAENQCRWHLRNAQSGNLNLPAWFSYFTPLSSLILLNKMKLMNQCMSQYPKVALWIDETKCCLWRCQVSCLASEDTQETKFRLGSVAE